MSPQQVLLPLLEHNEFETQASLAPTFAKVSVWTTMSVRGIIDPYFIEDEKRRTVTLNSERYAGSLDAFLVPELQ